jgi:GH3 auxin-responsive promoter
MSLAALAGCAWAVANAPGYWRFRAALADPRGAQQALLRRYLHVNAGTAFGRAHGFGAIRQPAEYQQRVPLAGYEDLAPWIARIAAGEARVLTWAKVKVLESTGGSTRSKQVPYTSTLQAELRRAVAPWIVDLYRRRPQLVRGRSYWSITPVAQPETTTEAGPRVGFEDDSAYLGGPWRRLLDATFAVPSAVRWIADVDSFRYVTLLFLLHARDLTLISVWHPSFLGLLLEALPRHWNALMDDLETGRVRPPAELPAGLHATLQRRLQPNRARARELRACESSEVTRLWPRLGLVSCWGDGHAALHLEGLRRTLPGVELQPKGLLATEACVTIPFEGRFPLAVRSHFFEFLEDGGRARPAHELETGGSYSVVVTTGGGLYRYRLEDRVVCDGRLQATPTLRFLGKESHVADVCGEKLREQFVAQVLRDLLNDSNPLPQLALLAPDLAAGISGYTLYLQAAQRPPATLARLDAALRAHGDYRYARDLGQLAPPRLFRIRSGAVEAYFRRCREQGQRLGDVKPLALSARSGWSQAFDGDYESA